MNWESCIASKMRPILTVDVEDPVLRNKRHYARRYYRKNADKVKENVHKWQTDNAEKKKEIDKEFHRKNPNYSHEYYLRVTKPKRQKQREQRICNSR